MDYMKDIREISDEQAVIHRQSQKQEDIQCVGYRGGGIEKRYGAQVCG